MSLYEYIGRIKRTFHDWCETGYGWSRETKQMADLIRDMLNEYDFEMSKKKPSDPPQPPEMPECVAKLLDATKYRSDELGLLGGIVREYYRQPLKLEVGKVYEDASGVNVMVAWIDPAGRFETIGVDLMTGAARYFNQDGTNGSRKSANLIREVAKP